MLTQWLCTVMTTRVNEGNVMHTKEPKKKHVELSKLLENMRTNSDVILPQQYESVHSFTPRIVNP